MITLALNVAAFLFLAGIVIAFWRILLPLGFIAVFGVVVLVAIDAKQDRAEVKRANEQAAAEQAAINEALRRETVSAEAQKRITQRYFVSSSHWLNENGVF